MRHTANGPAGARHEQLRPAATLIGRRSTRPHACNDSWHLPSCYNPWIDVTACACGAVWWTGQVGTWHSRALWGPVEPRGPGFRPWRPLEAWDVYFLHAAGCDDPAPAGPAHLCGGVRPALSYAEAVTRS